MSTGRTIKKEDWDNENYCGNVKYVRKKGSALNVALDKIKTISIQQLQLFENEHNRKGPPRFFAKSAQMSRRPFRLVTNREETLHGYNV